MPSFIEEVVAYSEPFKAPIEGASPVGSDISYDPDFETLKAEIDKLASLAGEQPNWSEIVVVGEELLRERSKDLRILMWSSIGRLRTRGLRGFAEGLATIKEVCGEHWEPMFPSVKRGRARGNLAGWLSDQAALIVGELSPGATDREALVAIDQLLRDIDALFASKLGQDHPGFGTLLSVLRDKTRRLPEAAPAAPPPPRAEPSPAAAAAAPAAVAPPQAAPVTAPSPPAAPALTTDIPAATSAADVLPTLRAVGKTITEAAALLRKEDPAQAWPYKLQRTGLWLVVKALPPNEGGKTRIPPPQGHAKKLEALATAGQWMELLNTAESLSGQYIFWFDLQRWAALALDRMGALFLEARAVVGAEAHAFIQRFPALVELKFADGTPFADAATVSWLEEEAKKHGAATGGGGSSQVDEEERLVAERFAEAKELASAGKTLEALALGSQLADRGADVRTRFRGRLAVAQMALSGGKPDVAHAVLEGLLDLASLHELDAWEPRLAAQLYGALLACRRAGAGAEGSGHLPDAELFTRLCRVDPAAALKASSR